MTSNSTDYPDLELPPSTFWTAKEVASWIADLGFSHYKVKTLDTEECFEINFITGRKLVLLEAKHLPSMGITNFEDIKCLTAAIRKLLGTKLIGYFRNKSFTPREPWAMFLELHSRTGEKIQKLTYPEYLKMNGLKHGEP